MPLLVTAILNLAAKEREREREREKEKKGERTKKRKQEERNRKKLSISEYHNYCVQIYVENKGNTCVLRGKGRKMMQKLL